jgi:hypothetical protein
VSLIVPPTTGQSTEDPAVPAVDVFDELPQAATASATTGASTEMAAARPFRAPDPVIFMASSLRIGRCSNPAPARA